MRYRDFADEAIRRLLTLYDERESSNIVMIWLEERMSLRPISNEVFAKEIPAEDLEKLRSELDELLAGRPLQYVLGYAWFMDMTLSVDERVLIPRPETEELAVWIRNENKKRQALRLLDIGTGSGCIALYLKRNLPEAKVQACDISPAALSLAKANALKNHAEVVFFEADILHPDEKLLNQQWDIIVSNPPYILSEESKDMRKNVFAYEPHLALFVNDTDPLEFYRSIAEYAIQTLNTGGQLYFEVHEDQAPGVKRILEGMGFVSLELRADMQGKDRMIRALK